VKEISAKNIRLVAMDLLARREHSRLELTRKLHKRFSDKQEEIEEELDRLQSEGLQCDARLAEAFLQARTSRGQGPSKIRNELKGKGVSQDAISLAFEACEVDWFDLAQTVAEKKFGDLSGQLQDLKSKGKVSRFMQQRGFSYDHISSLD
jgi:regulatory protein